MTAVIITHPVMFTGGSGIRAIEPGEDPVELPDTLAADLIRHGLAQPVEPPAPADPEV